MKLSHGSLGSIDSQSPMIVRLKGNTMTLSMYETSAPFFIRHLTNISNIISKGAKDAETRKIEHSVLLEARLAPDMLPLVRQIQIISDNAKGAMSRLAGVDIPSWPDTETSFPELQARIAKTIDYVKTFNPEQINGSEDRQIFLRLGWKIPHDLTGKSLLMEFQIPDFMFHCAMVYAILRHNGVMIGKQDFLGEIGR